jgi:hypothetical protein
MDLEQFSSDASEPEGREKGSLHDDEQEEQNPANRKSRTPPLHDQVKNHGREIAPTTMWASLTLVIQ